ncbi:nitrate- and nitrite sensing domain-containing protein [Spirillospora sp. NPDC029432]|uniref:sensor histidine kinase n=1 Tax=Spirillospora sp. NPDC029432 TaxID=3154599 RepID=UPI0034522FB1
MQGSPAVMSRRFSSIRTRIILLILVPLISLAGLWAFATDITYGDARQLQQSNQFQEKSLLPTQALIAALQKERRLSMGRLGGARNADGTALAAQRKATDEARELVRRHSKDKRLRGAIDPPVRERIDAFVTRLGSLELMRRSVDGRAADRAGLLGEYSGLIDSAFAIYAAVAPADAKIAGEGRTLITMARAREFLAREDALFTGAAPSGRFTAAERAQFAQLAGAQRYLYADNAPGLHAEQRERLRRLEGTPEHAHLRRLEDQIIRGAEPGDRQAGQEQDAAGGNAGRAARTAHVGTADWRASVDTVTGRLFEFENEALDDLTGRAEGIAFGVVRRLGIAGGLGLVAIVVSVLVAVRVSRRLLDECRTLARGVVDFTQRALPALADTVREGGRIEEIANVPDREYRIREIRQISESFVRAREAVLTGAAREMAVRGGISEVFVNLARRNQALLHRQLSLLDTMERRTEDPAELSDLFRLDHLATRMRRHAEGLVILAGKTAGRGWRRPVPMVDVVRGAVAEVEDYPRVRVQQLPRLALQGTAVADTIHLLAEIVENATTFSPPQSPVRVSGHAVANGFVVEVEDRGLGMTDQDLRAANERLADPPEFDPSDSARLGLFVVARLARRHGISVTLRQSPYGGTTAIALIPAELIVETPEPDQIGRRSTGAMAAVGQPAAVGASGAGRPAAGTGPVRLVAEPPAEPRAPEPERPAGQGGLSELPRRRGVGGGSRSGAHRRPETPPPGGEPPAPAPAPTPRPEPVAKEPDPPLAEGELPRRRRQTHLAPQLKERVDADLAAEGRPVPGGTGPQASPVVTNPRGWDPAVPDPAGHEGAADPAAPEAAWPDPRPRAPEEMRSIMSSMQRGWERGRRESGQAESGPAEAGPGDQARAEEDDTP